MQFSNKIFSRSVVPKFRVLNPTNNEIYLFKMEKHGAYVEVSFDFKEIEGDEFLTSLDYKTALTGEYLGLLDGLIELYQDRAIQALPRLGAKELDHFLRDEPSTPAVSYYDPKFYEILSLGELINKKRYGNKDKVSYLYEEMDADFSEISFSEQIEYFEEFLSKCIYKNELFKGMSFDFEDFNSGTFHLSSNKELTNTQIEKIEALAQNEFNLKGLEIKFD